MAQPSPDRSAPAFAVPAGASEAAVASPAPPLLDRMAVAAGHAGRLGLPPTGRWVRMRVMDWWRREGGLLRENWVLLDMLMQCGLARSIACFEARRRGVA